jgi:apolipoprotein N-acyltransferase
MPSATSLLQGPRGWRWGFLAGAVAGGLVALSLPPFGWWPLAWIGLALVAACLPGRSWRVRLAIGAGFGLVDYLIGLMWVQEFSVPGYVAVVVISAVYAVLSVVMVPTARRAWVAVALPCTFVLVAWARDRFPLGGLPLAGLALGQASGPLAPVLRLGGSLGLVASTAVVGVALAEVARLVAGRLATDRLAPGQPAPAQPAPGQPAPGQPAPAQPAPAQPVPAQPVPGQLAPAQPVPGQLAPAQPVPAASSRARGWGMILAPAGAALVVAVALPLAGALSPSGAGGNLPPMRVGLVQGGGPRGTRAINTDPQVVFNRALTASSRLSGPLNLVVWPEGMLQSHRPFAGSPDAAAVAALAVEHDATVLVGVEQDVGTTRYLNEVVAWDSHGRIVGRYVKNHLVPFGEYVPFRSIIDKFFDIKDVPYDAIPGHGPGFLDTSAGPLAIMISFEVFFDSRARGGVRAGGQLLVVPTNTASYRSTQVPTQEVAADKMRAWETGRWLVQVTPTGYSTVVSPTGRVLRRSRLDAATVIQAVVPRRTGMTVYDHIGDATVVLLALVGWAAVASVAALSGRRRGALPAGEAELNEENNERSVPA